MVPMLKRPWLLLAALILAAGLFFVLAAGTGLAQTGSSGQPTDDQVNAIAKQLYCPVCENIPLDVCGTQACEQWRELIRQKLSEGWTEDQIKQYFVDQYGDRVLATPPARGLNWLVYLLPPVIILAGVYILYRAFRSWQTQAPVSSKPEAEPQTQAQDEYVLRLEEELRKR